MDANFSVVSEGISISDVADKLGVWPSVLVVSGSKAYGTDHADSDTDLAGFYTLPTEQILGLSGYPDRVSTPEHDPQDVVMWEAGKFVRLALDANPHALEILFTKSALHTDEDGELLIENRNLFLSERVRESYGGYVSGQLKRIERAHRLYKASLCPADTIRHAKRYAKSVLHCYRLLQQGYEILTTGQLTVRLNDANDVVSKSGLDYANATEGIAALQSQLATAPSVVFKQPETDRVNELLLQIRRRNL